MATDPKSGRMKASAGKVGPKVVSAAKQTAGKVGSTVRATARKAGTAGRTTAGKAEAAVEETKGLSTNPMTNLIIADIALRGGGRLLRHVVERTLLGVKYSPDKARDIVKGRTMTQSLVGTAVARIATRSVPGALLVGGGLLAKALYDRRKNRGKSAGEASAEGGSAVDEQARKA